ncbi:ATP synthase subunit b, mitochondrial-like [Schistocerca cancellata]|uniref:ATP synthase subunit b, mitochondrial-like n=1 Tax=Schistocerca cancellata TaxID=274614 RepID=UPI0021181BA7|nr:ATP synthase subunit b, mitochondrial-like [Schistocerca cancellata]
MESPDEFTFFYKKNEGTGPYVFGLGLTSCLCSKEIYVMERERYNGLSFAILIIFAVKKLEPKFAKYADAEVDKEEAEWNEPRKRIGRCHMVSWIVSSVLKSITSEQEKQYLRKCIAYLKASSVQQYVFTGN